MVFLCLVLAAVGARLAMAWLLPPLLDVYYYDSQAAQALLHGLDPYGHLYTGVPVWLATPGASNVFAYLPAVPLFLLPFGLWDVRLGLIAADLVVALSILALGGRHARTASLVFLLAPFTALFSTSYPNNTLVAMAFLGLFAALEARGKGAVGALLLGISLAASQFLWLLYPLFVAMYLRKGRMLEVAISLIAAAAVISPFLVWDYNSFLHDAILFQFARIPQSLLTPMPFGFNVNPTLDGLSATITGTGLPILVRLPSAIAALVFAALRSRDIASTMSNSFWFILLAIWVLPSDFSWWYLELPFQILLMWFILNRGRTAGSQATNA